jgi:hypothetical protein
VDSQRNHENQYTGEQPGPKIVLVGCLEGTVDGRPVRMVAENGDLVVELKMMSLLSLRRTWPAIADRLISLLKLAHIRLLVRAGWVGSVEITPNPSRFLRLLLPRS